MIFTYTSYKKKVEKQWAPGDFSMVTVPEQLYQCEAGDIMAADKLLLEATGIIASKEPLIQVRINHGI